MKERINLGAIKKNIKKRVGFPASVNEETQKDNITKLFQATFSNQKDLKEFGVKEVILSSEEQQEVHNYLNIAKEKLLTLGIRDAEELLPNLNQILFIRPSDFSSDDGFTSNDATLVVIILPEGKSIKENNVRNTIFHELSHFITRHVFIRDKKNDTNIQIGFSHNYIKPNEQHKSSVNSRLKRKHFFSTGIYEEPMSDLFALYCIEGENEVFDTPYIKQDALMISLLEEFANETSITPFEAFKKMFSAKVKMDFSFQKELTDVFGVEAMRGFNTVISMSSRSHKPSSAEYKKLAQKGGFFIKYLLLLSKIEFGQNIKFSGLSGSFKNQV